MEMETKIQRAINVIEKRPGIRTDELARAIGVEPAKVAPLIFSATSNGFITTCKVERPGKAPTNEYRLSSSVVASDWDAYRSNHTAEQTKARKAQPYRRDTAQGSIEHRAVQIAVDRHNQAAKSEAEAAEARSELADWKHKAAYYGITSPAGLDHYCASANNKIAELEEALAKATARIEDMKNGAQIITYQPAATHYTVATQADLFDSAQAALDFVSEHVDTLDLLENCVVLAGTVAGKVAIKATLVAEGGAA